MSGADGTSLGGASVEVDGASPQPSNGTEGLLWDLVMHGANIGVSGNAAPGDVALDPGPLGTMSPGVSRLLLSGSPGFLRPSIDWRRVEDNSKLVRLQDATVERLLHEMLASVSRKILCRIRVSLKKERKTCMFASSFV
jgi:hypothetical protein